MAAEIAQTNVGYGWNFRQVINLTFEMMGDNFTIQRVLSSLKIG